MMPSHSLASTSLGWAIREAAVALVEVRAGRSLPEALAPVLAAAPTPQARGAVQDIAYRTMRGRGRADFILNDLAKREPEPALTREILVAALCLFDFEGNEPPYSPFTVVDEAVKASASRAGTARGKGFVNAILRNALRASDRLGKSVANDRVARLNYPAWWIDRVEAAYPKQAAEILAAGNAEPPLTLRVNVRRTSPEQYLQSLNDLGIGARLIGPVAVRLDVAVPVLRVPGFSEGLVSVQDEAAQRAAPLLDVQDGQRVLDACAAPGGKSGHLCELADIDLDALDIDRLRLQKVAQNLSRLGRGARLIEGDAAHPETWWDGRLYDRILADVPCTAAGIVRRHPDIRWLRRPADIAGLSRLQQQILDALWRLLSPGGKLLLVTCSIFPEEGQGLADRFLARHLDAIALEAPGQLLPRASPLADHDGLFFAVFEKRI